MRHAVIMAGGAGVRLWPLSRRNRPKQLLRLFDGKSLVRRSYERVAALLPPEQIHVITGESHLPIVAQQLPELPSDNLLGEPVGRDTANAVGLSAAVIAKHDAEAVIGMFTADHIISPLDRFREAVRQAYEAAEEYPDALLTMGIKPTRPDTNYGYVRRGRQTSSGVFEVEQFTEKPDASEAEKYVASGAYYWNSGMFAWRAETILDQLRRHLPESHAGICRIADAWSTDQRQQILRSLYPALPKISIDFAVMERADHVLVVEMACDWIDVGSWPAMELVIARDGDGNVSIRREQVIHHESRGNIVVTEQDHLIATIGLDDVVIVHSPDATLVCRKRDAHKIKALVETIGKTAGEDYL